MAAAAAVAAVVVAAAAAAAVVVCVVAARRGEGMQLSVVCPQTGAGRQSLELLCTDCDVSLSRRGRLRRWWRSERRLMASLPVGEGGVDRCPGCQCWRQRHSGATQEGDNIWHWPSEIDRIMFTVPLKELSPGIF